VNFKAVSLAAAVVTTVTATAACGSSPGTATAAPPASHTATAAPVAPAATAAATTQATSSDPPYTGLPYNGPASTRPAITAACQAAKSYLEPYAAGYGQPLTFPDSATEGAAGAYLLKQGLAIGGTAVGQDLPTGDVQDDMATFGQLLQQASRGGAEPSGPDGSGAANSLQNDCESLGVYVFG
jgi:hypothetical protein